MCTMGHMETALRAEATRHTEPVGRPPMKNRQYKISDDDYFAAMRAADERRENLSEEVRNFVVKYGRKHAKKKGRR